MCPASPVTQFFCFLPYEHQLLSLFLVFFVIFFCKMPPKSRAAKQLMPHNRSPDKSGRKRKRKEPDAMEKRHIEDCSGSSRSSCHHSRSPLRKCHSVLPDSSEAEHMPAWAKKLLEAHNKSKGRLQCLESKLKSRPRSDKPGRAKSPQVEFKYKRNKVQYELNAKVLENWRPQTLATRRNVTRRLTKVRSFHWREISILCLPKNMAGRRGLLHPGTPCMRL